MIDLRRPLMIAALSLTLCAAAGATTIVEVVEPPSSPGGSYSGTFEITPSAEVWGFGVGNPDINDTSISGIRFIDGLPAKNHWISSLISRTAWTDTGYSFESIRPIGATGPSAFFIDTTSVAWQWGSSDYVAFYWLYEDGPDAGNPQAVLQPGRTYDAFRFFASDLASPFAAFTASNGGTIITGETILNIVPEPGSATLLALGLTGLAISGRRGPRQIV